MERELRSLARRFRRGDAAAFEALHARSRPAVFRYAHSYLGQREAAEEVTQEVYLAFVANITDIPDSGSVLGYLLNGVRFRALDRLKRARVERHAQERLEREWVVAGPEPENRFAARQELERVNHALGELALEQRSVVLARTQSNLTFEQIAEAEGIPLGTALTRNRRGLSRLRALLQGDDDA